MEAHLDDGTRGRTRRQRRLGAGLGLVAGLAAVLLAACSPESEQGPTTELDAVNADEIAYGVSRRLTREGVQEAILFADSMFFWRDSAHAKVVGLTLVVFDDQGRRRANIEADEGRLSQSGNELTATGNAILRIPVTGQEIRTEELHFAPDSDRIWSDQHVEMREAGCVVEGDRFQADMAFDDLQIWGTRDGECRTP